MYDLQLIENRIVSLANKAGLSKNKLLFNAKLNKSVFDNMKKGQIPSVDKIHIIADYLDCSVDYLLGRTDNPYINYPSEHKFGEANDMRVAAAPNVSARINLSKDEKLSPKQD